MSEHLPECWVMSPKPNPLNGCICRELQACEQRAYKRGLALARGEAIEHYQQGAAASLREALAVLEKHRDDNYLPGSSDWIHVDWALGQVRKLIDNEEER